jgi:hypothetical protein
VVDKDFGLALDLGKHDVVEPHEVIVGLAAEAEAAEEVEVEVEEAEVEVVVEVGLGPGLSTLMPLWTFTHALSYPAQCAIHGPQSCLHQVAVTSAPMVLCSMEIFTRGS